MNDITRFIIIIFFCQRKQYNGKTIKLPNFQGVSTHVAVHLLMHSSVLRRAFK